MTRPMNVAEAAKLLRCAPSTLKEWAKARKVPSAKAGRSWLFLEADLLAHLRSQYQAQVEIPCPSTIEKAARSGGPRSRTLVSHGYVNRLEQLIAARRKNTKTS